MKILKLREHGELAAEAALWFHSKWHIPVEEYAGSIQECLSGGCVRCRGIAGKLLGFVCEDMRSFGLKKLYLITDHTSFYERYGWKFLCMVQGDGEPGMTRMYSYDL